MNAQLQPAEDTFHYIALDQLQPDPDQPRKWFDPVALQELADDIAVNGIIEPIIYFINTDGANTILAGERRYKAAALVGLDTVPCILRDSPDAKARLMTQVSENFQREGLNAIELALFFDALITQHKIKVSQVGDELATHGLKKFERSYISNLRRLLKLPAWAQDMIQAGTLNAAHGKILLEGLKSEPVMQHLQAFLEKQPQRPSVDALADEVFDAYGEHYHAIRRWNCPFDTDTLCKGCENSKPYPSMHVRFCMDNTCFDAHAEEAAKKEAAQKAREDKRREKQLEKARQQQADELNCSVEDLPPITTQAEDGRVAARAERTQAHLDNWLRPRINAHLIEDKATRYQLVTWMAAGAPRDDGYTGDYRSKAGNIDLDIDDSDAFDTFEPGIHLTLHQKIDPTQLELMICSKGIDAMGRDNLRALAHHCGITLQGDYVIDREYLDIKIKQEIIDIAPAEFIAAFDRNIGDWEKRCKGSTNELKQLILECANDFGVPADLQAMYNTQETQS